MKRENGKLVIEASDFNHASYQLLNHIARGGTAFDFLNTDPNKIQLQWTTATELFKNKLKEFGMCDKPKTKFELIDPKHVSELPVGYRGTVWFLTGDPRDVPQTFTSCTREGVTKHDVVYQHGVNPSQLWGTGFREVKPRYEVNNWSSTWVFTERETKGFVFGVPLPVITRSQADRICEIMNETP